MFKQLVAFILFLFILLSSPQKVSAAYNQCVAECRVAGASAQLNKSSVLVEKTTRHNDKRVAVLEGYLAKFSSPLVEHAGAFVQAADRHELDWRLIPAISGAESTFGKRVSFDSHNPFGYADGYFSFESWETAIDVEAELLANKYRDGWGLKTPEEIMPIYAPPSKTWAKNVRFFMNDISRFERDANRLALNL